MVTLEMQMIIHAPTFPQETKTLEESAFQAYNSDIVGFLVPNEHLGFYAIIVQSVHQTVGGNAAPPSRSLVLTINTLIAIL